MEQPRPGCKSRWVVLPFAVVAALVVSAPVSASAACVAVQAPPPKSASEVKDPFGRGMELFRQGKLEEAYASFRLAETQEPRDPIIQSWIGFVLFKLKRYDDAIKSLNNAVRLGGNTSDTHNNLGNAYLAKGELDAAIAAYRRAVELVKEQTGNPDPHYNLGNALVKKGDLEGALAAFLEAEKQAPDDAMIQNNLGYVYERKNGLDPAKNSLTPAIEHYRKAAEKQPNNPVFHRNLGLAARRQESLQETALQALQRAVQLDPKDYTGHLALAELYQNQKQAVQAIAEYKTAAALRPKEFVPVYNLGLLYARLEKPNFPASVAALQTAFQLRPSDFRVAAALGWVNLRANRPDLASTWYRKAIQLKPDLQTAHANLGVALERLGQTDAAVQAWKKALDLDPKDSPTRAQLAAAYLATDKFELAVGEYRKVVQREPKNAGAFNNLGYALEKTGKLDDAVAAYKAAIEASPELKEAHNNLGAVYERQGHKDLAKQCYLRAQQIDPKFEDARRNLQRLGVKVP